MINIPKGLFNISSNCYMNSLIQCLFYTKAFRKYFLETKFKNYQVICFALREVFIDLFYSNKKYCSPEKIINEIIKNKLFLNGRAADVTDLLDYLFYSINEELNEEDSISNTIVYETQFYNQKKMYKEAYNEVDFGIIINRLFVGFFERIFKCSKGHIKYSFFNEYKLIFPLEQIYNFYINKNIDIYDCFKYYERNQNDNEIENCQCGAKCILNEKIFRTPKILILILDRGKNKRFKKPIQFYEYINLSNFIDDKSYEFKTIYKLIGLSSHLGNSGYYGHYISFCLNDDNNYYYFDDSNVEKLEPNKKIEILYKGYPYILFYERLEHSEKINFFFKNDNIYNCNNLNYDNNIRLRSFQNQENNNIFKKTRPIDLLYNQ